MAIEGTERIKYNLTTKNDKIAQVNFESLNSEIATVNEEGRITGKNNGETTIKISVLGEERIVEVIVTDLIQVIPDCFDYNKELLTCGIYTKEENDLLDEILASRIKDAGYQSRAGVIAAVKFLTLEFPYRIAYFNENGRLDTFKAYVYSDGEGRYYHKGLYLDESRYEILKKSISGPGTWGCPIYSSYANRVDANGLDCSGFLTWALFQAGFDPGDIGAGVTKYPDMTDLGEKIKISEAINKNILKMGDLLNGKTTSSGHIAMFVGSKNDDYYYVAEALWASTGYFGVVIRTYTISELEKTFAWYVKMDNYYLEDGNLTDIWN